MEKKVIHLIGNAHLDPVWLWDAREGLNEGISTCRTILQLMREYPELTFSRGEAALYEHIERFAPEVFGEIRERVAEKRWELLGGNYIQPDDNLPSTRTALEQYRIGCGYFLSRFGQRPEVSWLADVFGHPRGAAEIMLASGFRYFAFCRPQEPIRPIGSPVFFWKTQDASRKILCNRSIANTYASYRTTYSPWGDYTPPAILDQVLERAKAHPYRNIMVPFGLGDHGGGPTRAHLDSLRLWKERHPEIELKFSRMCDFFHAVEEELADPEILKFTPVVEDEINFTERGCAASCRKFKRIFRQAENQLRRTAFTTSVLHRFLPRPDLTELEKVVCFNSFHDILTGTLIERAHEEQLQSLGGVLSDARNLEFYALMEFARHLSVRVPDVEYNRPQAVPHLFFNPFPRPFRGFVELESQLDFHPVWDYQTSPDGREEVELRGPDGALVPFQRIHTEHNALTRLPPVRFRMVFELELPASGYRVFTVGFRKNAGYVPPPELHRALSDAPDRISNALSSATLDSAANTVLLSVGKKKIPLGFGVYHDRTGSWGDQTNVPANASCLELCEEWKLKSFRVIESGPERAMLHAEFGGESGRVDLRVSLTRNRPEIRLDTRVLWGGRSKRLKMIMPQGVRIDYDVPGGSVSRGETPIVPGGRFQKVHEADGSSYFLLSDSVYAFENEGGSFAAILARGQRYSSDGLCEAGENVEMPIADHGELLGSFVFAPGDAEPVGLSEDFELPPVHVTAPPHEGELPPEGSFGEFTGKTLRCWDMSVENGHRLITVQNPGDTPCRPGWNGTPCGETLEPWRIATLSVPL